MERAERAHGSQLLQDTLETVRRNRPRCWLAWNGVRLELTHDD